MQARLPLPGRALALALSLIAACLATGCSSTNLNGTGAGDISASGSTVRVTQQLQITPKQLFTGDHLTYSVNGVVGGNAEFGTITSAGLYTAPAVVPTPNTVTITATSALFPPPLRDRWQSRFGTPSPCSARSLLHDSLRA